MSVPCSFVRTCRRCGKTENFVRHAWLNYPGCCVCSVCGETYPLTFYEIYD
jgi:hypothetical protein